MSDIEEKAMALVNEVLAERGRPANSVATYVDTYHALCRAIEQHEAFRQEVSDAIYVDVVAQVRCGIDPKFRTNSVRFVIAKPDPLVEAMQEWWDADGYADIETFRAAIAKRGGKIVWED